MPAHQQKNWTASIILFATSLVFTSALIADEHELDLPEPDEEEEVKFYQTPEERLDAGFKTPITDWLTVSGLLEIEKFYPEENFAGGLTQDVYEPRTQTLQIGFDAVFTEALTASLVFEAEYQDHFKTTTEEAVVKMELEDWEFELGYLDLPFGEYYSQFISGPMLEFGETTSSALVIEYGLNDHIDALGYVFDGNSRHNGEQSDPGWGLGMDFINEDESIRLGVGYLSNLAESDENFLEDFDNSYIDRVPAWNANVLIGLGEFGVTAEVVRALKQFKELESGENKPVAYNLEGTWFYSSRIQFALRLGYSSELPDNPEWQYGAAVSWRPGPHWNLSVEYIKGKYKNGFVTNDDDNELDDSDQYGLQISFEF